ncbi:hypothetical protein [Streptomyces sp. BK205]|nr:hypothetical protein [Streptomyces sp. BK205]
MPTDLDADARGRLRHTRAMDLQMVRVILALSGDEARVTDAFAVI